MVSGVGWWRCGPFEPKLKAFVQEARWSCSGWRRMEHAMRSTAASVQFSVDSFQSAVVRESQMAVTERQNSALFIAG